MRRLYVLLNVALLMEPGWVYETGIPHLITRLGGAQGYCF